MSTLLLSNVRVTVTVDREDRVLYDRNIFIKDRRIDYIGDERPAADEIIDGSRLAAFPGLINTHHHLYQTFTRNLPQVQNLELFDWLTTLYEIWRGLTPQMIYYSSLVGMGELLKYGCTTCFDHHYVFPRGRAADFIDQQFRAAGDLGIRFHAARGSMSRGRSDGGLPPDDLVETVDEILDDSRRLIETYHDPGPFSMRQMVLAPCSPFSVTDELMVKTAELARAKAVRLHTHLAETADEEEYCLKQHGVRPLEYMRRLGWLGPDVWYAHGIHFTDAELQLLAATGTGVAHCPVSNQKLSSGTANIPRMLELGVPVGLAVDGSASNDCSNLLAEIRSCFLLHRLTESDRAPSGYDVLKLATVGGAGLLGRADLGRIEVGKAADLFLIDIDKLEYVGALRDPAALPATVGICRPAAYTIVNGKVVVRDGELCGIDEPAVVLDAGRLAAQLVAGG